MGDAVPTSEELLAVLVLQRPIETRQRCDTCDHRSTLAVRSQYPSWGSDSSGTENNAKVGLAETG